MDQRPTGCSGRGRTSFRHWRGSVVGDPTEGGQLVSAAKARLSATGIAAALPRADTIPFSSDRQWMATRHDDGRGTGRTAYVKGAAERVLQLFARRPTAASARWTTTGCSRPFRETLTAGYASRAFAVARCDADETIKEAAMAGRPVLVGVQAMLDPQGEDALAAVRPFHTADHSAAARGEVVVSENQVRAWRFLWLHRTVDPHGCPDMGRRSRPPRAP